MTRFVALRWPIADHRASDRADALGAALASAGWACPVRQPGWHVWCERRPGRWMLHRLEDDRIILVGRLFERRATEAGLVTDAVLPDRAAFFGPLCQWITENVWGSYVALRQDPENPESLDLFRDPVGMVECATWTSEGIRIATSHPEAVVTLAPPKDLAIDWNRLADIMLRPVIVSDQVALRGIDIVPPGTWVRTDGGKRSDRCLWSPTAFALAGAPSPPAIDPTLVDACTAGWASCSTSAVAELSGGLDSAIVAAGITAHGATHVRSWFNYYAVDPRGDERRYALSIAHHLGLPLETIGCPEVPLGPAQVDTMPVGLRPGFGSTNFVHDADLANRARALGADMLLTGNGGDSLFFQDPSSWIAADLRHSGLGWRARLSILARLSAWTGTSIWSLAAKARGWQSASPDLPETGCTFLTPGIDRAEAPIPWLVDADALAPAKRLQLLYLAIARSSFNPSWCADVMSVAHPLMSQPLLEHVLPIPAVDLTEASRDRALARRAYAGRLPASVIGRHGKGVLTPYYGRRLAASTGFLRDYLLGGILAERRVIDLGRLEPILDPDHLMHSDHYAELLLAILAERWARVWSDRCRPDSRAAPRPRTAAA